MPLPSTIQPHASQSQTVVRQKQKVNGRTKSVNHSINEFIHKTIEHWKADLKFREFEGEHFQEWFAWQVSTPPEFELSKKLEQLLGPELKSLNRMIETISKRKGVSDMHQLLSTQQIYLQYCDRFDRLKKRIMNRMNLIGNAKIY